MLTPRWAGQAACGGGAGAGFKGGICAAPVSHGDSKSVLAGDSPRELEAH